MKSTKLLSASLRDHLTDGETLINRLDEIKFSHKPKPEKWSKKEILGHLIDSAINNLGRFTSVRFEKKPFAVRPYDQDKLVKANNYQEAEKPHLTELWKALNLQICLVFDALEENELSYPIVLPDGKSADVRFLAEDYVDHLAHHLRQMGLNP